MNERQNKYTDNGRTESLKKIGFIPLEDSGFQIHELLNMIPENIFFKKSFHNDGSVFINWKKKTRFFLRISNFMESWGYDLVSYNDCKKVDQAQSGNQFVDLIADFILYLSRMKKLNTNV